MRRRCQVHAPVSRQSSSPESWDETLRSCHVRDVFIAERLEHHAFFCAEAQREENPKRDQVGRPSDPVGEGEQLADGKEEQCCVHRVADAAIDALRDELMVFADLERDRPVLTKVCVRAVEQPEADGEADDTGDQRNRIKGVLRERERRRDDPDDGNEEADPDERQEKDFSGRLAAPNGFDRATSASVGSANGDHDDIRRKNYCLRDPGIHGRIPSVKRVWLTQELSDAGGPARPDCQLTPPARVRSSDLVLQV